MHIGVYDITERDHIELQRRRHDFESLARYLAERDLFFSANHVFSSLTGRRKAEDFLLFESAFPALETRNGHMLACANRAASVLADSAAVSEVGGSDAHVMHSVGSAYTVAPRARDKEEFLDALRMGQGRVRGEMGGVWKLMRDVLTIGGLMVKENPWTAPVAALGVAVPAVVLGNYFMETAFARMWMARYLRARDVRQGGCGTAPMAEVAA
jgi:hypothetical protein